MMLGREVRHPVQMVYESQGTGEAPGKYIIEFSESLWRAHEATREHLEGASRRQKSKYDAKASITCFVQGNLVLLLNEKREIGICPKLQAVFEGPFIVTKVINDWICQVQLTKKGATRVIHMGTRSQFGWFGRRHAKSRMHSMVGW